MVVENMDLALALFAGVILLFWSFFRFFKMFMLVDPCFVP
jgi:hypothetical protein